VTYDSTADTKAHIARVQELLQEIIDNLTVRAAHHDESKLAEPEKSAFDRATPALKELVYGTPEYKQAIKELLGPAVKHHYEVNDHHPEHYENGIAGMSLLAIVEMFCDWRAASERMKGGSLAQSLKVNRERFGANDMLSQIFENTRKELDW
jgi:hypothetical protein